MSVEAAQKRASAVVGRLSLACVTKKLTRREALVAAEELEAAAGLLRQVAGVEKNEPTEQRPGGGSED